MLTFNEWIAYIYRETGHPETKIKLYEQNCRREVAIQNHQRWVKQDRRNANVGTHPNHPVSERD